MEERNTLANIALFVVALVWGGGFIVTKGALDFMDPVYLLVLRFSVSAVLMGLVFHKRMRKATKEDLIASSKIGLFLYLAFMLQTIGLQFTTVSQQAFITSSNVVMVPFIVWFVSSEKPDKFELLSAVVCFFGLGLLSLDESLRIGIGEGLTLICAVFFGTHISLVGKYAKKHDPIVLSVLQFAVAAVLSIITCPIMGIEFAPITPEIAGAVAYMGIGSTVIAFGLQNVAQKYTSTTNASLILSLEAVVASFLAIIFIGEELTLKLIIGSGAIFFAIITAETKLKFIKIPTFLRKVQNSQNDYYR